jgi:hypothetical protein
MRKAFCVLLLLVALTVAVGFFRDWFSVSLTRDSEMGQTDVHLCINDGKLTSDAHRAKEWIAGVFHQGTEPTEPLR